MIALTLQDGAGKLPDCILIFDNQHCLRSSRRRRGSARAGLLQQLGLDARQVDMEGCTLAQFARDSNPSRALMDDPVNRGEPESRALTWHLSSEERFE